MSIVLVRLITGDEIMGSVENFNDEQITITNPLIVDEAVNSDGYSSTVLRSYVPFNESSEVNISKNHIINWHNLHPTVIKYYELSLLFSKNHEESMMAMIESTNEIMLSSLKNDSYPETIGYIHTGTTALN